MIEIKNLTKFYGRNAAVRDLSFNVLDNEILGFLGPNGAGKSTTMNIITGFLPSTSGTVLIEGVDIAQEPSKAKKKARTSNQPTKVKKYRRTCEFLRHSLLSR